MINAMVCTFCFASDGKEPHDARQQANKTGKPVLFFEGVHRYVLFPDDETLYDYTHREDIASLELKKLRNDMIRKFGVDPEMYK